VVRGKGVGRSDGQGGREVGTISAERRWRKGGCMGERGGLWWRVGQEKKGWKLWSGGLKEGGEKNEERKGGKGGWRGARGRGGRVKRRWAWVEARWGDDGGGGGEGRRAASLEKIVED